MVTVTPLPTPKRSKSDLYVIVLLAAFVLVVVVLWSATHPWSNPPLWQIKRISSLEFPDSARVVDSHGRFFLEIDIWAKIEMDKADVEQFLSKLPPSSSISDTDRIHLSGHFGQWGDPASGKQLRYVTFTRPGKGDRVRYYIILINLDDPHKAVVYLWYHPVGASG